MEAPILAHTDVRPPPEPPPAVCPPPEPIIAATRLTIPQSLPLEKGRSRPKTVDYFPQGSLSDPGILIHPASPTTPFEFPFPLAFDDPTPFLTDDLNTHWLPMDNVTRVVGLPRVYGLRGDKDSYARVTARVNSTAAGFASVSPWTMMDGGANICVTGLLELLVDVEPIPPLPISVATKTAKFSIDSCCTKKGLLPLTLDDGSVYYQPCHYCKNATETIISPDAILQASDILVHWQQEGHRNGGPGNIRFSSDSGLYAITLSLEKCDGLYYCPTDVFTVAKDPTTRPGVPSLNRIAAPSVPAPPNEKRGKRYYPVHCDCITEPEAWMLRLGSPGKDLPGNVTGIPPGFQYHPFCFIDWKEEAHIQKQAAQRTAERTTEAKRRFYMDFGFMRASTSDFFRPNKKTDRFVTSNAGFSLYLLIVDKATRFIWVFLTKSKAPPLDILDSFFARFGHEHGSSVRMDQGGELARSFVLSDLLLRKHRYVMEPTGADSPSQNGAVEIYNDKLAVCTRTLLYGAGLPAKYWSSALQHSVYIHNRLVHTVTKKLHDSRPSTDINPTSAT